MSNAVIYVRVSTDEQVEGHSLDTQVESCRRHCASLGLDVLAVYRDEGFSAKTADRPQFTEMVQFCLKNAKSMDIAAVVVHHSSRFARNTLDHMEIRQVLSKKGIRLLSASENFGETAAGKMHEGISAVFNQFDNDLRSERTSAGMQAAMRKGRWVGPAPTGYVRPPALPGAPSLEPYASMANLVIESFQLAADGSRSTTEVWQHARDAGLLSSRGRPISKQAFGNLLKNEVYTGRIVRPQYEIDVVGAFEPLITRDLFIEVQRARGGKTSEIKETRRLNHPDFPLKRVIKCAECGLPITGSWSKGRPKDKKYGHYRCRGRGCGAVRIKRDDLHALMQTYLASVSVRPEVIRLLGAVISESWSEREALNLAERRRLEQDMSNLEGRERNLLDKYLDDKISEQDYMKAKERFSAEGLNLGSRLALLDATTPDLFEIIKFAESLLSNLAECWNRIDPLSQSVFVAGLFPDGLTYANGGLGTTESPWFIRTLGSLGDRESSSDLDPLSRAISCESLVVSYREVVHAQALSPGVSTSGLCTSRRR